MFAVTDDSENGLGRSAFASELGGLADEEEGAVVVPYRVTMPGDGVPLVSPSSGCCSVAMLRRRLLQERGAYVRSEQAI